jgi:hypothetical protein
MRSARAWAAAAIGLSLVVSLSACSRGEGSSTEEGAANEPVTITPIQGTNVDRLTMTRRAAERLDLHLARTVAAGGQTIVLAGAVLFEPDGETFVYISSQPLAFVHQTVEVDHFQGDIAVLSSGLRPGTNVVTLGAAELYGAETGLEED